MALAPLGIQAVAAGVPQFVRDLGNMDKAMQGVGSRGDTLARSFVGLGRGVIQLGATLGTALVGAAGAAAAALATVGFVGLRQAAEAERVVASLEAVLAAAGSSAKITSEEAQALAFRFRDLAGGSDEAVLAAEAVLLRFKNLRGAALEPALLTALDLAVVMGTDVATAAGQLGRALELPGEGLRVLKAAGVILTDEQTELIDKLVETGQIAAAQNFLMKALAGSIGGTAARAAETFSGQLTILRGHILEQAEAVGFVLLPSFSRLLRGLSPLVEQVLPLLVELFRSRIGPAVDKAVGFILNLVNVLADAGPFSLEFREALLSLLPTDLQDRITAFGDRIAETFGKVKDLVVDNKDAIIAAIQGIGAALAAAAVVATILKIVSIIGALTTPLGIILTLIGLLRAGWETNFLGMRDAITAFWTDTAKPALEDLRDLLEQRIPPILASVRGFFDQLFGEESQAQVSGLAAAILGFLEPLRVPFDNLTTAFQGLIETLGLSRGAAETELTAMGTFFQTTLGPTTLQIIDNLIAGIGNLANFASVTLERISTFWAAHGDTIIRVVSLIARVGLATIENFLNLVAGAFAIVSALIAGDFQGAFDASSETLTRFFENALAVVGTNLDEFLAIWTGVFDSLAIIVSTALTSVIEGVTGFFGELREGVVGGFEDVVSGLADFLGLGSPSRLFMAIGQQMMAGLAEGIQASVAGPTLALQVAAGQVAGAAQNTTNNNTNNFNLNVQTSAPREPMIADFEMLVAQSERISRRF